MKHKNAQILSHLLDLFQLLMDPFVVFIFIFCDFVFTFVFSCLCLIGTDLIDKYATLTVKIMD